jgi:hypothetical protein
MTLIVILNAVLAIGIVGVMVALHSRAILLDHRQHHGSAKLWSWRTRTRRPATDTPHYAHRNRRSERPPQRRGPAALLD